MPVYHELFSGSKVRKAEDILDPTGDDLLTRILVDKFLIRLYSKIFRVGYFIPWNDQAKHELCSEIGNGVTVIKLDRYINAFFGADLLNRDLFEKHSILTNKGIQEEWLNLSINYFRRKNSYIISEYSLLTSETIADSSERTVRSLGRKDKKIGKHSKVNPKPAKSDSEKNVRSEESTVRSEESTDNSEQNGVNVRYPFNNNMSNISNIDNTILHDNILNNTNDVDGKERSEDDVDSSERTKVFFRANGGILPNSEETIEKLPPASEKTVDSSERTPHSSDKTKKKKEKPPLDVHGPEVNSFKPIEHLLEVYFTSNDLIQTREQLAMNTYMDLELLKDWAEAFNRHLILEGTSVKQRIDWIKHFKNWMMKQDFKKVNPKILHTEKDTNNGKSKQEQPGTNKAGSDIKGHQPFDLRSAVGKIDQLPL